MRLEGNIDACEPERISGWARDADDPAHRLALEVRIGARAIGACVADGRRGDLAAAGKGDCAFAFVPTVPITPGARDRVNLRPAGGGEVLVHNDGGPQPDPFGEPPAAAGSRFRRAVLHIGTEKTGTTSLQRFLALNRGRLAAAGVFVPQALAPSPDLLNHSDLVAAVIADWRLDDGLRAARGVRDEAGLARFRADVAAGFAAEIARAPPRTETLLLSSEHCHSRVLLLHEIAALQRFLAPCCAEIEVWVYLRPQHELAASQYAMHLLAGTDDAEMLPRLPYPAGYRRTQITRRDYFDYANLLARWSAIFGRAQVRPAIFSRATLAGGSVVEDLLARLGVATEGMVPVAREAGNISARAQRFLVRFNHAMATRAPADAEWAAQWLAERLRRSEPGQGILPARVSVVDFMAQFAASNERVRAEWFPARATLFDIDFERFPQRQDEAALSGEAMIDIMVGLLREARRLEGGAGG